MHISYVHCKLQIYDCKFCCYYIYYVSKRCLVPAQSIVHTISGEYFLFFLLNHEDGLVNRKTPCLFVKCRCPYKHVNICKINVFHMYVYISFFLSFFLVIGPIKLDLHEHIYCSTSTYTTLLHIIVPLAQSFWKRFNRICCNKGVVAPMSTDF